MNELCVYIRGTIVFEDFMKRVSLQCLYHNAKEFFVEVIIFIRCFIPLAVSHNIIIIWL